MTVRRLVLAAAIVWTAYTTATSTQAPQPQAAGLFSSHDVVAFKLTAPLNELFAHATRRGEEDYSVLGTLAYKAGGQERTIEKVEVSLRGHTSRATTECTFPKLKLKFSAESALDGSPFAGTASLKVGTHCGESNDGTVTAKYGRLANEASPHREAFVYRLLDAVGIPTLKARPARITYVYADAKPGQTPDQQQPIERNGMILENTDSLVARLGGTREIEEEAFNNARDQFTPADTASLALAEAMIGNFDWCLKMTPTDAYRCDARHPLWNIIAVAGANGRVRPAPYDFDVSGMVVGRHRWFADVYNEAFLPSKSHPAIEVLGQVQRTRSLVGRADLDEARARFMEKKKAAYDTLAAATLDNGGRQIAKQYLDSFFEAIGSDEAFYRPVVVAPKTLPYADSAKTKPVCAARGAIPVGTTVSEPVETDGSMMKVMLLDTQWHWAPPTKCDAVHTAPVWVDSTAVSPDYPPASVKPTARR
jgi:hypothetical protein